MRICDVCLKYHKIISEYEHQVDFCDNCQTEWREVKKANLRDFIEKKRKELPKKESPEGSGQRE